MSSEQQFNSSLSYLDKMINITSMGEKKGKRKYRQLTLVKRVSQISESYLSKMKIEHKEYDEELKILKLAYSNVRLVDGDIFLSTIADPSSTRKRIETDVYPHLRPSNLSPFPPSRIPLPSTADTNPASSRLQFYFPSKATIEGTHHSRWRKGHRRG